MGFELHGDACRKPWRGGGVVGHRHREEGGGGVCGEEGDGSVGRVLEITAHLLRGRAGVDGTVLNKGRAAAPLKNVFLNFSSSFVANRL
jgi:hypothetical protein